ncbi:uncharacterized protein MELLADRAFT_110372 [Melampsora larici-populina 98AG31]|uniref:Probable 26S proteasome regulatory subunit p27 n=1 Tax=Melampsora larici-populina (strain 98AG31 / pathotype 3-4-7) TaxID=747676 RepID=F4RZK6_MELLP|nr:uncharacterized protein MELLADRAFT_110372 [Melampsora larici-populina 98AG31]EGG02174.1 hypothetical protein MELLADRAFT_110372 [Melampsora larici-populina 98AG31]
MMGRSIHGIESKFNQSTTIESNHQSNPKERYKYLSRRKKEVEIELNEQFEVLKTNQTDLSSSLIDRQGFPRDDILDLPSVRVSRSRIHELKNDLRQIIEELSKTLPLILKPSSTPTPQESPTNLMKPFAQVDLDSDHSPAYDSGIRAGDQLIRFGDIDVSNHDNLKALVSFTKENEGNQIDVVWFRTYQDDQNGGGEKRSMMSKTLVPCSGWGGRGLLGFHIVPI